MTKQHNLTAKQQAKAKRLYKKTGSQKKTAKAMKVAKWRINLFFQKKKIGKRVASPFWKDVAAHRAGGYTHKEAIEITKYSPKWKKAYKKRTGKTRLSDKDRDNIRRDLREAYKKLLDEDEMGGVEYEGETYFDTPK